MGGDGRMALSPETKRAFVAYGGKYSFDGAKLVTRVDGASSPDLLEDQARQNPNFVETPTLPFRLARKHDGLGRDHNGTAGNGQTVAQMAQQDRHRACRHHRSAGAVVGDLGTACWSVPKLTWSTPMHEFRSRAI